MICLFLRLICSDPTYSLSGSILTIRGTGEVTQSGVRSIAYTLIQSCVISEGITSLARMSFTGCSSLTSVTLPISLKKLDGPFSSCSKLTELIIPEGVEEITSVYLIYGSLSFSRFIVDSNNIKFSTFDDCLYNYDQTLIYSVPCSKTTISFPPNIKSLGTWSFATTYIQECHFPSTIESLAYQTYVDNKNTINVTFSPLCSFTAIPNSFFHQTHVRIFYCPPNVTSLGSSSFYGSNIPEFSYMDGSKLQTLVKESFLRCDYLTTVRLPKTIKNIDPLSFSKCPLLSNIIIESSNPYIYSSGSCIYANENKSIVFVTPSAEEISIIETAEEIGSSLLQKCENLKHVVIEGGQNLFYEDGIIYSFNLSNAISALGGLKTFKIKKETKVLTVSLFAYMEISVIIFEEGSTLNEIKGYCFDNCMIHSLDLPLTISIFNSWSFYYSNITSIAFGPLLSAIGVYSFNGCTSLKSITFDPNCPLKTITTSAFYRCGVDSIVFPNNLTNLESNAFGASQLVSIYLSDSIKSLSTSFASCTKLKNVIFGPGSLCTEIEGAFSGCTSLEHIDFPPLLENVVFSNLANLKSVSWASNSVITSINSLSFSNCPKLSSFELPKSIIELNPTAFVECTSLTSFTYNSSPNIFLNNNFYLNDGILYSTDNILIAFPPGKPTCEIRSGTVGIGNNAFYKSSGLVNLSFSEPCGVDNIGMLTFYECKSLEFLKMPSSVKAIGSQAFYGCSKLKSISFDQGSELESIGAQTFSNCTALEYVSFNSDSKLKEVGEQTFASCNNVKKILLPLVSAIGDNAFQGCTNLETVEFNPDLNFGNSENHNNPKNLSTIPTRCFYNCLKLVDFQIPSSVTTISDFSFFGCASLKDINLPINLEIIGDYAFSSCGLKNLTIHGFNISTIGMSSFAINPDLSVVYYCGTKVFSDSTIFNGCNRNLKIITLLQYPANSICGVVASKEMIGCLVFPSVQFTRPSLHSENSFLLASVVAGFYSGDDQ